MTIIVAFDMAGVPWLEIEAETECIGLERNAG